MLLIPYQSLLIRTVCSKCAHTQNTASQYNLQVPLGRIAKPQNRVDLLDHFDDPSVKMSLAANLDMISAYDQVIDILEQDIISCANAHDATSYALLKTVPGVGRIIALNLLYEIADVNRFPQVRTSFPIVVWSNA